MIHINEMMFTENHLIATPTGLTEAKNLKAGQEIIGQFGQVIKIKDVYNCGKRPDAPIVGEFKKE